MKIVRDAVHGDMAFDELEWRVIDTPPMQRLRGIKQLGMASLVFPSAVHTRFEHSLGAAWMAKKLLNTLEANGANICAEDRRTTVLAALLHDVTHVPFGHTFEDERRLFERHDEDLGLLNQFLSQADLKRALESAGQYDRVRDVLAKAPTASSLAMDVVSGAVGADLLDYLQRDAIFCGLALRYDERLFQLFSVVGGRLVVKLHKGGVLRRDALSELIHLLQMRYALTERVYYHHAKCAAGAMVSRALELAMDAQWFSRDWLAGVRDDTFLWELQRGGDQQLEQVANIVTGLVNRRLHRRVYMTALASFGRSGLSPTERDAIADAYHYSPERRRSAEKRIAGRLGAPNESDVIIYCPSPTMSLKEADVPVEIAPDVVRSLAELGHPDVEGLKQKHTGIWRFYVFLKRDAQVDRIHAGRVCEEVIGHLNLLGA